MSTRMRWLNSKKKSRFLGTMGITILLCGGCTNSIDQHLRVALDGAKVHADLHEIAPAPSGGAGVAVYGEITIIGSRPIERVNLGCVYLFADSAESNKLYVDSIASVLAGRYPSNKNGTVKVSVYWVFSGEDVADFNLDSARLVADDSKGPCVIYAP